MNRFLNGDCLDILRTLLDASVDSCVTDPPYELNFMGRGWDNTGIANNVDLWREVLRVLKPGAHLLAFSGTRTYHRMTCAIEDVGFEIRDQIGWAYGTGFPKSHNLDGDWQGWGTALKPAWEPICVARKPLAEKTVAANVQAHGTGAINIDGCRVGTDGGTKKAGPPSYKPGVSLQGSLDGSLNGGGCVAIDAGRWPANIIHDGSDEVLALFPTTGPSDDGGSAARFFYCAKASKSERGEGNNHPTVEPVALMRYLCRLVTPPGGMVLDPFGGSGTTAIAARAEGFEYTLIEREMSYYLMAVKRIWTAAYT